jgi:hypothetical protein
MDYTEIIISNPIDPNNLPEVIYDYILPMDIILKQMREINETK